MKNLRILALVGFLAGSGTALLAQPISATNLFPVGITIPDGSATGLAVPVIVDGPVGPLSKVRVQLNVSGTWSGDLFCYLVKGTRITTLLNRVGRRAGDNFGYGDPGINATFDDAAANGDVHVYRFQLSGNHTTALGGALTGEWAPDGRAVDPAVVLDTDGRTQTLATFNGEQANGEWVLFIADMELGDMHQLVSWSLELTGEPLPLITTPPASTVVECGQPATLTVVAESVSTMTYQWQKNGANIPSATSSSLAFTPTTLADSGTYRVLISNANGTKTSPAAILSVTDTTAPAITTCAPNALLDANYVGAPDPVNQNVALPDYRGSLVATDLAFGSGPFTVTQNPAPGTLISTETLVTFSVTDGSNNTAQCTSTVSVNKRPVATGATVEIAEDQPLLQTLLGADADVGNTLTLTIVTPPANGVLTGVDTNGVVTNNPVTFQPALDFIGLDSFSFMVDDGRLTSLVAVVDISVTNVYDLPRTPEWVTNEVAEGNIGMIALPGLSPDNLALTYAITRNPTWGTFSLVSGVVHYQPMPGFNGQDTFEYTITDSLSGTVTGQVQVQVQASAELTPYAFTNAVNVLVGAKPKAIVASDFLKDYRVDLAVANQEDSTVSLLRGYIGGVFSNVHTFPVGNQPVALALGDFNKDNRQDLAVLCAGDKTVQIYLNMGLTAVMDPAGALALATNIALSGINPVAMVAMDFNKDLYVDMAVLDGGDGVNPGSVEVFMHQKFVTAPVFDLTNTIAVGVAPTAIAAGAIGTPSTTDKPDLVVANGEDDNISVLVNVGYGMFTNLTNIVVGAEPSAIELGDLNGDKVLDIVVANADSDDITVITNAWKNVLKVAGSFGVPQGMPTLGLKPKALALGNFVKAVTAEIKLDVAVLMQEPGRPQGHVAILRGNGTNSLNGAVPVLDFFWFDPGAYYDVGAEPVAMVTSDFNGDRLPDLAVVNSESDDVSILINNWLPLAYSQRLTLVEDVATNIVLGGTFGPLDYIITVWPTNGTLEPSNSLGYLNMTTNPVLLYTPLTNRYGRDLIKYYVDDGFKTSRVASLTFTILPVNDQPAFSNAVGELGVVEVPEDWPVKYTNFVNYFTPAKDGVWGEERQRLTYYFKVGDTNLFKGRAGLPRIVGTNLVMWFIPTNQIFGETLVEMWAKDSGGYKTNKPDMRPFGENNISATQQFIVRITNVNDAPYFKSLVQVGPKTTYEDRTTNWTFLVWDIDSGIDSLALTVTSTNTALLDPLDGAQLSWTKEEVPGTNAWRVTVNVSPAADQFGRSLLTFTISDGTNSSSKSALLTVLAVNDQPDFVLLNNALTISSPLTVNIATNRIIDIPASKALLGPPNETNLQRFMLFKVLVSTNDLPKLAALPTINPLTGDLIVRTRSATNLQTTITLGIYAMDSGGVVGGGVNTSAVQTVTLDLRP